MQLDFISLQWDLNGSAGFGDSTKDMDTLISEVASVTIGTWDSFTEPMSYKEWVQTVLYPGNKYDKQIKAKQEAKLSRFFEDIKGHSTYERAWKLYSRLAENYLDKDKKVNFNIFPALTKLIEAVSRTCKYTLAIRTFGEDGPRYAAGLPCLKDAREIKFKEFSSNPEAIFKLMKERNILGQDDFHNWSQNQLIASKGKLVICSADAKYEGQNVISIFGDDNLKKGSKADPGEKNIAFPVDIYQRPVNWDSKGVMGIRIKPIKMALFPDYLISKVNKRLEKRGFLPLKYN